MLSAITRCLCHISTALHQAPAAFPRARSVHKHQSTFWIFTFTNSRAQLTREQIDGIARDRREGSRGGRGGVPGPVGSVRLQLRRQIGHGSHAIDRIDILRARRSALTDRLRDAPDRFPQGKRGFEFVRADLKPLHLQRGLGKPIRQIGRLMELFKVRPSSGFTTRLGKVDT